jgi:hypothetical protein
VHFIQLAIVASEINLKSDASADEADDRERGICVPWSCRACLARVCRIEVSVHTAADPRQIVQRFERSARAGVMIDQRAERALGTLPLRL